MKTQKITYIAIVALVFLVESCSSGVSTPEIVTKDVNIAIPVPCTVDTKNKRPDLLTLSQLQQKLETAPNVDSRVQLIVVQLLNYMGWLPVVEGALKGCEMKPEPQH